MKLKVRNPDNYYICGNSGDLAFGLGKTDRLANNGWETAELTRIRRSGETHIKKKAVYSEILMELFK